MQVLAFEGGCAKDADRPNTWHRARYALHVERGRGMSEQSARWKGGVSMNKTDKLAQIIQGSSRMVFFGGAGMSTESGIPDFRSADGIYSQSLRSAPKKWCRIRFCSSIRRRFLIFSSER